MNEPKEMLKKKFLEWAEGKTLDEIADKFYDAINETYKETTSYMLAQAFDKFVKPVLNRK